MVWAVQYIDEEFVIRMIDAISTYSEYYLTYLVKLSVSGKSVGTRHALMRTEKENGLGIQQPGGQESASVLGKILCTPLCQTFLVLNLGECN